jgi:hypothetical protein
MALIVDFRKVVKDKREAFYRPAKTVWLALPKGLVFTVAPPADMKDGLSFFLSVIINLIRYA